MLTTVVVVAGLVGGSSGLAVVSLETVVLVSVPSTVELAGFELFASA